MNGDSSGAESDELNVGKGKYHGAGGKIPCDGMGCDAGSGFGRGNPPPENVAEEEEMVFRRRHMMRKMNCGLQSRRMSGRV